ncbi:nuclear transport factor 2 family protein [Herbiconiux sp. KACC 21604]|uniref:nuclear transport factor 2 family protein n=1 Tax=unclassified Herbiconiux TaxID=2618217 RepID=UPI0014924ECE|nr:nuclear transport factor 2 family protein [Herbiconiux sp. SALV-R1]QJU55298.1 nuclear transport factor 2 family protein [Herbiconiux sp. SALV-R1]WPO86465.1 nuclear transport factor 2 family protein [Herbiconiux sp. KACC 21604]
MNRPSDVLRAADAREQLHALVVGLWYEIDHDDGTGAAAFFTPDATLTFERASFRGRDEIAGVYAARTGRGPRVSRHLVTNFHLLRAESDRAAAVSVLLLFGDDGSAPRPVTTPLLIADVADSYERVDGEWLISDRRLTHQFIAPDSVLAVPTR